ncbi:MAG: hypothetical protein HRU35_08005 [Rickettsiaceae bacterium]|nr:hypothetical protein [Rickettsiaceae bacterium]
MTFKLPCHNRDQHLIEIDDKIHQLDEDPIFDDYNKASNTDKEKLKQYANFDKLDEETRQKLKDKAKEYADKHEENNRRQELYVKKQVQLFKTSIFIETVLKSLYLQHEVASYDSEIANKDAMSFCSYDWNMVKNTDKINEYKELIMSKMAVDMFKLFDNEEWVLLAARKDYL